MTDCDGQQSVNLELTGKTKPMPIDFNADQASSVIQEIQLSQNPGISLIIPIKVQGLSAQAVVDTAAQVSIISNDLFDKINHPKMPSEQVLLRGAGKGSKIIANKFSNVPLIIGDQTYHWDLLVAPIED